MKKIFILFYILIFEISYGQIGKIDMGIGLTLPYPNLTLAINYTNDTVWMYSSEFVYLPMFRVKNDFKIKAFYYDLMLNRKIFKNYNLYLAAGVGYQKYEMFLDKFEWTGTTKASDYYIYNYFFCEATINYKFQIGKFCIQPNIKSLIGLLKGKYNGWYLISAEDKSIIDKLIVEGYKQRDINFVIGVKFLYNL